MLELLTNDLIQMANLAKYFIPKQDTCLVLITTSYK